MPPDSALIVSKSTWPLEETQSAVTGWIGVGPLLIGAIVLACYEWHVPSPRVTVWDYLCDYRYAIITGLQLVAMAVYELAWVKVYRRHFDFSAPRPSGASAWKRICKRCLALYVCVIFATFLYLYLGEYSFWWSFWNRYRDDRFYVHYLRLFKLGAPAVCILCWPYFYLVERYAKPDGPPDEFLILAGWIRKSWSVICSGLPQQRHENAHVANLARGMLVKFFFIPVMTKFCFDNWSGWEFRTHALIHRFAAMDWSRIESIGSNFFFIAFVVYMFILLADVTIGLVGYIASCRLLDTHVTSADPTLLGWTVALLCYPPIRYGVTGFYLEYSLDDVWPESLFASHPVFSTVMMAASLGLMAVYAWATVAFGLRFSNVTNRGVICSGPYAYVRHPAYISKNTSWWIGAVPFLLWRHPVRIPFIVFGLLGTNIIYAMRALTEERHLMREPHYREYCKKVPWRFIPGLW